METIGDRVSKRMKLLGIEQTTLAKRCGTTQASLSRLVNNKTDSPEYIWELSQALVTSVQWLKTGIEDIPLEFMLKYKSFIDSFERSPKNIKNSILLQLDIGVERALLMSSDKSNDPHKGNI